MTDSPDLLDEFMALVADAPAADLVAAARERVAHHLLCDSCGAVVNECDDSHCPHQADHYAPCSALLCKTCWDRPRRRVAA